MGPRLPDEKGVRREAKGRVSVTGEQVESELVPKKVNQGAQITSRAELIITARGVASGLSPLLKAKGGKEYTKIQSHPRD